MAKIIANSINVDKEYSEEISREIKTEGSTLIIKYDLDTKYTKSLKKSLNTLYENLKLIILTIKDFSPKA